VEEIEEAECECCAWLSKGCRKPANTKKLDAGGEGGTELCTIAVFDTDRRDTGNVDKSKLDGAGWHRTRFPNAMTKLIDSAKVG
jgi:hypothetical protein